MLRNAAPRRLLFDGKEALFGRLGSLPLWIDERCQSPPVSGSRFITFFSQGAFRSPGLGCGFFSIAQVICDAFGVRFILIFHFVGAADLHVSCFIECLFAGTRYSNRTPIRASDRHATTHDRLRISGLINSVKVSGMPSGETSKPAPFSEILRMMQSRAGRVPIRIEPLFSVRCLGLARRSFMASHV